MFKSYLLESHKSENYKNLLGAKNTSIILVICRNGENCFIYAKPISILNFLNVSIFTKVIYLDKLQSWHENLDIYENFQWLQKY
jgi:hypothetical protein